MPDKNQEKAKKPTDKKVQDPMPENEEAMDRIYFSGEMFRKMHLSGRALISKFFSGGPADE